MAVDFFSVNALKLKKSRTSAVSSLQTSPALHSMTFMTPSCSLLSAPRASPIALYISEFRDIDVIPIGYNLTVVCTGNKSRHGEGNPYQGQPVGVELFFRNESVKNCGGRFNDMQDSKSCELHIEKVARNNSGQYVCMVVNARKCSIAELTLSVRGE